MCKAHTQTEHYDIPEKTVIFKGLHFQDLAEINNSGTLSKSFSPLSIGRFTVSQPWHPGCL